MKPFFLDEGGKKCGKLQLAVEGPGLSIAYNTIFCLQCMDAGSLSIHPADQHTPCRHYTFRSNVAEEHQSYPSVQCCIACTYLLELLSVDRKLLLPLYYRSSVHYKGFQYCILTNPLSFFSISLSEGEGNPGNLLIRMVQVAGIPLFFNFSSGGTYVN